MILNIWMRRKFAKEQFPVGSSVRVCMDNAWLDGKVGEVLGYDMYGPDIDLELHVQPENVKVTAPIKNCQKV